MTWRLPPDQSAMGGVLGAQDTPLWLQSGMQDAPPNGPAQRLLNPFNSPRRVGIGESVANALLPQRDEQGIPQAPGIGDFVNAAMWALPGMRGGRPSPVFAAEKGAGSGGGKPSPGDTYNAIANMAATGDARALVAHANKFNIPNEQVQAAILQAYDNHKPTATSAYNRFLSARGELK